MFYALDKTGKRFHISEASKEDEYCCPICGSVLIQRKGNVKQHHFAHKADSICTDSWSDQYDMSDWHHDWQKKFPVECREVVCCKDGEKHRADVLIGKTVIEFQHSSLSSKDFARRNDFYHSLGYKVIWLFDCVSAYADDNIEQIEGFNERYKWKNPIHTLDAFTPRQDKVTVFLQMTDNHGGAECTLTLKLNWVSPNGMHHFCAREWFSEVDFLRFCGIQIPEAPLTPDSVFDRLIQTRDKHNNYCYSTCIQRESQLVLFEDCDTCKYRTVDGCIARFRDIDFRSITEVTHIDRDLEGRILRIDAIFGRESITLSFPALRPVAKTLPELWDGYKPLAVARFTNLRNGYSVQLSQDPNVMAKKYGRCYGKLCRPGGDFDKRSSEVYDWNKPCWIITWYK